MNTQMKFNPVRGQWLEQELALADNDLLHVELNTEGDKFVLRVTGKEGTYASWKAQNFLSPTWFPELKRIQDGRVVVPVCDTTVEIIDAKWPRDQVKWDAESTEVATWVRTEAQVEQLNAELFARFKAYQAVTLNHEVSPEVPAFFSLKKPFEANEECELSIYQKVAATCSSRAEGYGLFMEQGTGKTPVAIASICRKAKEWKDAGGKGLFKVIIVCPNNVRANWIHEFEKFSTVPYRANVLRGGKMQRVRTFIDCMMPDDDLYFTAVICSYDCMVNMFPQLKTVGTWDLAVLDESHYIKWHTTKRCKVAMELRDITTQRLVLTGTPITNTAIDLYTQFEFMRQGGSGFSSFNAFRSFYGVFKDRSGDHQQLIGLQNLPFMQERLARMAFIIRKEEALPYLPPKQYDIWEVEMTTEQAKVYNEVSQTLIAELENELELSGNKSLTINNILTRMLRLAEITSGYCKYDPVMDDDGNIITPGGVHRFDPNPKIEGLIEMLKEKKPGQKTIVWACFKQDIRQICARLDIEGIKHVRFDGSTSEKDRIEAERAFNFDHDCTVFVGNPQAGGTGLNLLGYPPGAPDGYETNCDHVIYFSQNWSSTARSQSEDRAHRRGTRQRVRITDLCVPGTIDEEIRRRVTSKRLHALQVSDVREILKSILLGVSI